MRQARLLVCLSLLVLVPSSVFAQQKQGLDTFLESALSNSEILDEQQANVDAAKWSQYRAKWAWGPKLRSDTLLAPVPAEADADEFGNNLDEILALNLGPYIRQSFQVVIPIYTFGRITTAKELAAIGVDAAESKSDKATLQLVYDVKRAFYAVQLSNDFEKLLKEGGKILKDKLAEMEEAREFGEGDFEIKDLRKLQIFDAEIDSRISDNRNLGTVSSHALGYLTKRKAPYAVGRLPGGDVVAPQTLQTYLDYATNNRPDVSLLQSAVKARELERQLNVNNFYPNVFLATEFKFGWSTENPALSDVCRFVGDECVDTADLRSRPDSNPLNFLSYSIGLGMRWDFDFWQLRGKLGEVEAKQKALVAQEKRATGAIELEVAKLHADLVSKHEKVEITGRRLKAAKRWRDQFGLKMQAGAADIDDAVEPLKAYFEAKALNLQARFDYLVATAEMDKVVGFVRTAKSSSTEVNK